MELNEVDRRVVRRALKSDQKKFQSGLPRNLAKDVYLASFFDKEELSTEFKLVFNRAVKSRNFRRSFRPVLEAI